MIKNQKQLKPKKQKKINKNNDTKAIIIDVHYILENKKLHKYLFFFRINFTYNNIESFEGPFEFIPHKDIFNKPKWELFHLGLYILAMIQTRIIATESFISQPILIYSDLLKFNKMFLKYNETQIPKCLHDMYHYTKAMSFYKNDNGINKELTILFSSEGLNSKLRKNGRKILLKYAKQ